MKSQPRRPGLIVSLFAPLAMCLSLAFVSSGFGRNAPGRVFNVRDFGAQADGSRPDTAAIQAALDACAKAGGGTVRFPPGTYLSQPVRLRGNHTVLEIDRGATLQAVTHQGAFMKRPGDWLKAKSSGEFIPFIGAKQLDHVTLTGGGVIDGGGGAWWPEAEKARQARPGYTLPRPNLIVLDRCKNVLVENLTLRNSPKFHLVPLDCDDVVISNVTILAPERAANTDAIDPSGSNILITRCVLDTGDDNVAIKAGHAVPGRRFESENIVVSDCTFLHGHGMSIGSETRGGVNNLLVKNCTFNGTDNGIRIKTSRQRGGDVGHCLYENLTMTNVEVPILISCYYPKIPAADSARPVGPGTPFYHDLCISNLDSISPRSAGFIVGLPESLVSNVLLENVQLRAATGLTIRNARNIRLKNVRVEVSSGKAFLVENATVEGAQSAAP